MKTMHLIPILALLAAVAIVACKGDDGSDGTPTASMNRSTAATASPSATPSIEDEVGAAYLDYWDVYTDAVFNLDGSELEEVMTGPQLLRTVEEIGSLRQQNRAAKIDVEHNFVVLNLDLATGTAVILDEYANHSSFVDADTKELIGQPADGEIIKDTYSLTQVEGTWKVEDSVRDSE